MQELPIKQLLHAVTLKRLFNAGKAVASFALSAVTQRTYVWGRPFILTVEPTNLCNLKCPLCVTGNGKMTRKAGLMNFQTFERILAATSDHLFYLLLYHQGEPYLNTDFLKFVRHAKRHRICVATSTNGHFLDEETARQTVASGLDSIIISMDGAEQDSYEKYRVQGSLEKVKAGVQNLVKAKQKAGTRTPYIFLQFLVMKHNEHEVHRMQELSKQMGVDRLLVKTVQVESKQEAAEWLPANSDLGRYKIEGGHLKPKRTASGPCVRPWTSSLVNWDGSVVPCCFDKNGSHKLGTASGNAAFKQTWYSNAYTNFRTKMLRDRGALDICANCSQGLKLYR